jgi:hypothetical protein
MKLVGFKDILLVRVPGPAVAPRRRPEAAGLRKAGETVTCDSTLQQNLRAVEGLEERLVRWAKICRRSKSSFIDLPRGIRELRQSRSLISKTVAQRLF